MTTTTELNRQEAKCQLPDGWRWAKLCEVAHVFAGSGAPQGKEFFDPNGLPFVRVSDLGVVRRTANLTEVRDKLSAKALKDCSLVLAKKGTVVFPKSGAAITTNNRAILGMDAYIVGHLLAIEPTDAVISLWLYWSLCQVDMMDYSDNVGYPSLKQSVVEKIEIALPPLAEQKRIAGILQEQMAAVERARHSAEAQLQAAESLPTAHLRAVFSSPEAQQWPRKTLGELCDIVQGEALGLPELQPSGFPVYGANGRIGYYTRYHYEEPQVLVSCRGAKCATINFSEPKSYVTNNSMAMLPKDASQIDRQYLRWVLDGGVAKSAISGSAQPQITGASLSPVEIVVPPIHDQQRIASQLSTQMSSAERLRQTLAEQLDAINKLPAALLREAFSGRI